MRSYYSFLSIVFTVFFCSEVYSQYNSLRGIGDSRFSLEAGVGVPIPLSPSNNLNLGDAKKGELGLRYLSEVSNLGVRGYYAYASLFDSKAEYTGHGNKLIVHRAELQALYLWNDLLGISDASIVELESYLGLGLAIGKASSSDQINNMIASSIGIRPRVLIDANRFYVYADVSYAVLINQLWSYTGESIPGATRGNIGSMLQCTFGVSYRL